MAKDNKKSEKIDVKYKAADPKLFAMNYTDKVPYYDELSNGESIEVNLNDLDVKCWLANNIIIKE